MVKKNLFYLLFLVLAVIPIAALFLPGLPITHDGQDHVARIANFYQSLSDGVLIPRWAANLNWGYGHPILEFLYPLPSYLASLIHFVGISFIDSTKVVYMLGMILSFAFMYLWLSRFSSKYAALVGAVMYAYAPFRFVDLYVRGDIGENLAFAFVPLTLFFVYKLYKSGNNLYVPAGAISLGFLILSHNALSLMTIPFIFFYGLLLYLNNKQNKEYAVKLLFLFTFGFGISAFFWIPALMEGKYTLRNIVTRGGYSTNFTTISSLIYGPWSYGGSGQFTVQLGIFGWLSLILSPVTFSYFKKNKQVSYLIIFLIVYSLAAIFLMLPISNIIWSKIMLLQNFQFPWRFLSVTVLSTSILMTLFIDSVSKKINIKYITFGIIFLIVVISFPYMQAKAYSQQAESFYTRIFPGTTDTGESAPIWSVRFMERFPPAPLEVVDGVAKIKNLQRNSIDHKYHITALKKTLFEENTLYFPGWKILANGTPLDLQFQNMQYRGVMLFFLDKGEYNLEVKYSESRLRLISDLISIISVLFIFVLLGFKFLWKRK